MASCKVLLSRQKPLLNISICWNVSQRNFGKEGTKKTVFKKLGFPDKPKRPGSGYLIYVSEIRPQLKLKNPDLTFGDLSKLTSKMWKEMPESEKQKYKDLFQKKSEEYKEQHKIYQESMTEDQKREVSELMLGLSVAEKEKTISNTYKKYVKGLEKPKAPVSPYIVFCRLQFKNIKASVSSETVKLLAQKWQELSNTEKEEYRNIYKIEVAKFRKDMEEWEEKMIQQGHVDLVRMKVLKERLHKFT